MSERKVLNKYYPPDFDPSKIPRLRLPKNRQYTVRIMTPCNMRCNTCGDYISKAKKFNARKETVEDSNYLGLKIFRFYFKCPKCMAEITFKTDPKTCDYELEHGATRNFQALRLAEQQAEREAKEKEEEEKLNPMKMLENRTKASRKEMEELEALEELRDLSKRELNINHDEIIARKRHDAHSEQLIEQLAAIKEKLNDEEEDELLLKEMLAKQERIFGKQVDSEDDDEDDSDDEKMMKRGEKFFQKKEIATDLLAPNVSSSSSSSSSVTTSSLEEQKKPTLKRKFDSLVKVKAKKIDSEETKLENPIKKLNSNQNSLALLNAYSDSDSDSQS